MNKATITATATPQETKWTISITSGNKLVLEEKFVLSYRMTEASILNLLDEVKEFAKARLLELGAVQE